MFKTAKSLPKQTKAFQFAEVCRKQNHHISTDRSEPTLVSSICEAFNIDWQPQLVQSVRNAVARLAPGLAFKVTQTAEGIGIYLDN